MSIAAIPLLKPVDDAHSQQLVFGIRNNVVVCHLHAGGTFLIQHVDEVGYPKPLVEERKAWVVPKPGCQNLPYPIALCALLRFVLGQRRADLAHCLRIVEADKLFPQIAFSVVLDTLRNALGILFHRRGDGTAGSIHLAFEIGKFGHQLFAELLGKLQRFDPGAVDVLLLQSLALRIEKAVRFADYFRQQPHVRPLLVVESNPVSCGFFVVLGCGDFVIQQFAPVVDRFQQSREQTRNIVD